MLYITAQMQANGCVAGLVPSLEFITVDSNLHTNRAVAFKRTALLNKNLFQTIRKNVARKRRNVAT